ncbi:MAG: transglutaminase family protein, partial [Methylophilaceae bacterium]
MKLKIKHQTLYVYDQPVKNSIQNLRLFPKNTRNQKVIEWDINTIGKMSKYIDVFGNINHLLAINDSHDKVLITAEGYVETGKSLPRKSQETISPDIYLKNTLLTKPSLGIQKFIRKLKLNPSGIEAIKDLGAAILTEVKYQQGSTESQTSAEEAFKIKKGVCQDHSHIMIACCHELGLPARYISGYLYTDSHNETQTHAWIEVFLNNHWISYDISNQCVTDERYVSLAIGLDYKTASPIVGIRHGGGNAGMAS